MLICWPYILVIQLYILKLRGLYNKLMSQTHQTRTKSFSVFDEPLSTTVRTALSCGIFDRNHEFRQGARRKDNRPAACRLESFIVFCDVITVRACASAVYRHAENHIINARLLTNFLILSITWLPLRIFRGVWVTELICPVYLIIQHHKQREFDHNIDNKIKWQNNQIIKISKHNKNITIKL